MITQILSCCLWLGTPLDVSNPHLALSMGRPSTHLRAFLETRTLGAGEAVFSYGEAIAPNAPASPAKPIVARKPQAAIQSPVAIAFRLPEIKNEERGTRNEAQTRAKNDERGTRNEGQSLARNEERGTRNEGQSRAKNEERVARNEGQTRTNNEAHPPVTQKHVVLDAATSRVPAPDKKPMEQIPVSLNCVDMKLHQIIGFITDQTHVNVLLLAPSETKLTLRFTNRPLIDALRDICAVAGLSFLKSGNEFIIASEDKLKSSYGDLWTALHQDTPTAAQISDAELIARTYETSEIDAVKLIEPLRTAFPNTSLVMIAAPPQETPNLATQDRSQASGNNMSILQKDDTAAKVSRLLIIRGPRILVDQVLALAESLDKPRPQVNIAVTIHDISNDALKELGVEWSLPQFTFNEQTHSGIGFGSVDRSPASFQATLKALETHDKAKLLASPNISVLDGQHAYMLVGQRLTFPVVDGFTQSGQPIFSKQEEKVGVYLQVSVWVTKHGQIKLQLYPQVSTVTGFINVNGGSYPQISTREAQTMLTLDSGKTVVLGGLLKDEDINSVQSVPILSKIPILGELFTRRRRTHTSSQVIISITPTILNATSGG
jgi:type II secretory pathway component GspD/PulD (secretin)